MSLREKLAEMLQRVNPQDIVTTRFHSRDFNTSRAEYLSIRIRTLALLFAIMAPLWIPIDYLVLEGTLFWKVVALRLLFSAALFGLTRWGTHCNNLTAARMRVFLFILIPGLFFMVSHLLFREAGAEHSVLLGYAFLPLLMMALLTIVPLTLLEGLAFVAMITAYFVVTKLLLGTLTTLGALSDLWLLLLLGLIALWVTMSQLHMLMRLYREATRDALTGLVNRRVLSTKLENELAQSERPLALLLFDLDLFKRINDTYGHHTGDNVLKVFAQVLNEHCTGNCVAGRYGGEEFMAILPDCAREEAVALAEKIRAACHDYTVHSSEDEPREVNFTTSVGVSMHRDGETAEELLNRVDEGLYKAKSGGRDLVVFAD